MNKNYILLLLLSFLSNFLFSQINHWETAIYANSTWKYRLGHSNPSSNWKSVGFNEVGWLSGIGGIGYGDGDDNTNIIPVRSLYMRHRFDVVDLSKIEMAIFHADYDDAFVAYLNGVEIARSNNILGVSPAYDAEVLSDHEAAMYSGGLPDAYVVNKAVLNQIPLSSENVLAIQVHNYNGLNSSDLSSNFFLSFAINDTSNDYGPTPDWFTTTAFSSHLPIIQINTFGKEIPNEPSIPGEMGIVWNGVGQMNDSEGFPNEFLGNISIERRGQSSLWLFPKNGFAIETKDEMGEDLDTSFLNFPKEEDWVLHGPYSDKTLMRNVLVMDIARRMGQYASRTRFVELLINGSYEGIYVLMEKIKQDKNRVDIANLKEDDLAGDELTGGYVFKVDKDEADWYSQFGVSANQNEKLPFQYVSPKRSKIQPEQEDYIQSYVDSFEQAIRSPTWKFGGKRYDEYIDLTSFADNFIINELSKNVDGFRLSSYFHKDKDSKGGKIVAGPVWDYNLGFGNADYCGGGVPIGWERDSPCGDTNPFWWDRMVQDAVFTNLLQCRWREFRQGPLHIDSLHTFIDSQAEYLEPALERNFDRWPILQDYIWPNAVVPGSYQGEIDFMKDFLETRVAWMDANMYGSCSVTADNEQLVDNFFIINPNPTNGIIYLTSKNKLNGGTEFILQNIMGEIIKSFSLENPVNQQLIDLSELNNGIYFLTNYFEGKLFSKKIIVAK